MKKKVTKKMILAAKKKMEKKDFAMMHKEIQDLCFKRDAILQEIIEAKNRIAILDEERCVLEVKLKRQTMQVVVCEKMIEKFGKPG